MEGFGKVGKYGGILTFTAQKGGIITRLALYRKYRPQTFADVISQPHVTTTLRNQLKSGQPAHAYLFTGSRGTGKTTCAKILAKAVNCLDIKDGDPCLKCEACLGSDTNPDILEIDAASNNSVDDVRALRDEINYLPVSGKYKVYIIDEVHMLSASAFNALLKTLEEPPEHVVFILATTESYKIPATVLSRCQRFEFNRIDAEESAARLTEVAEKENIKLDKSSALLISRLSDGGMRDALSLLDVAASTDNTVTPELIRECAGVAGREHLFAISRAIAEKNAADALKITDGLYRRSKDPVRLIEELIYHFRNLMLVRIMPGDTSLINALPEEIPDYEAQAETLHLSEITRCLDLFEDALIQSARSRQRRVTAEMCLIKCASESAHVPAPATVPKARTSAPVPPTATVPKTSLPASVPKTAISAPPLSAENWEAITAKLSPFSAAMLETVTPLLNGEDIIIKGGEVLRYFFENPANAGEVNGAAREVMGRGFAVRFTEEAAQTREEPLPEPAAQAPEPAINGGNARMERFLSDVKEAGIQLTIQ